MHIIERTIKVKKNKNGLHSKENFWHAFLMSIMFYSKIIHIYRDKWLTQLNWLNCDTFLWLNIQEYIYWKSMKAKEFCIETDAVRVYVSEADISCFSELWWVITGKLNLKYSRRRPPIAPTVYLAVTRLVPSL